MALALNRKLALAFALTGLVPTLAVTFVAYSHSKRTLTDSYLQKVSASEPSVSKSFDTTA